MGTQKRRGRDKKARITRGMLLVPNENPPGNDRSLPPWLKPGTELVGHHLYLGDNRWIRPCGLVSAGQEFHRRMLWQFDSRWWNVV